MALSGRAIGHYRSLLAESPEEERTDLLESIKAAHSAEANRKEVLGIKELRELSNQRKKASSNPERTLRGTLGDVGVSAAKGLIGAGESLVGLADIPTFGYAGKALEKIGYDPKSARKTFDDLYSPAQKAANQRVNRAEGFWDTVAEMVKNPSTIAMSGIESAPSMIGAGGVGRALLKRGLVASPVIAGAIGEGAVSAGQAAEQIRQETQGGLLSPGQIAAAVASGVGTGAIGLVGGRIAQKLGFADVDTMLAGTGIKKTNQGIAKRIIGGGISEGVFEELPQSAQEHIWQNAALDKPLLEGVPQSAAQGMLVGGMMGAGANVFSGKPAASEDHREADPEIPATALKEKPTPAASQEEEILLKPEEKGMTPEALLGVSTKPAQGSQPIFVSGGNQDNLQRQFNLLQKRISNLEAVKKRNPEQERNLSRYREELDELKAFSGIEASAIPGPARRISSGDVPGVAVDRQKQLNEMARIVGGSPEERAGRLKVPVSRPPDRSVKPDMDFGRSYVDPVASRPPDRSVKPDMGFAEKGPAETPADSVIGTEKASKGEQIKKAQEAATSPANDMPEPTHAQKKEGNYKKGHIKIDGFEVSVENPAGSTRAGTAPDGKKIKPVGLLAGQKPAEPVAEAPKEAAPAAIGIGDRVTWIGKGGVPMEGTTIKVNGKSFQVRTDDGKLFATSIDKLRKARAGSSQPAQTPPSQPVAASSAAPAGGVRPITPSQKAEGAAPPEKTQGPGTETSDADRRMAAAKKMRAAASRLKEAGVAKRDQDRQTNTHKRAREAASAIAAANRDIAIAETMAKIADALERGEVERLSKVSAKSQVDMLDAELRQAHSRMLTKKYASYAEHERHKNDPITEEALKYVQYPRVFVHENLMNSLRADLEKHKGGAKLARTLRGSYLSTEDADAVLAFAKKHRFEKHLPWTIESDLKNIRRLEALGIKNEDDYRAALGEYLGLRSGAKKEDPVKALEREIQNTKGIGVDFFPTPKTLAARLVEMADIKPGMRVLEPSAGKGDIAEAVKAIAPDAKIETVEMSHKLQELLKLKGFDVVGSDFMDHTGEYDRIVMNPPFSKGMDVDHVRHAYALLKPGGRIVAIMGEHAFFANDKKSAEFREWLEDKGESEKLPEGSFKGRDAFNQTGVNSRVVTINRPREKAKGKSIAKGKAGTAYTHKNEPIEFEYAIVDASDLVVSHDAEFHKNEAYPQALQPRDRDRSALRLQVEKMANTINPARLGASPGVSSGAPIVGPDLVVESGNGRSIAIRKAYDLGKGEGYKRFLVDNAVDFGIPTRRIENIKNPVLIRIRSTAIDRVKFAKEANQDEIARMSPLEQTISDAELISDEDMSLFKPTDDGSISPYANQTFIKRFFGKLGGNESAGMVTESGNITKTGIDRIQAAVFAKAYADKNIIALQAEEATPDIKNILNALNIAAGEFAKARAAGEGFNELDLTGDIVEAAKIIRRSRNEGVPVSQIINQREMFSKRSVESEKIAQFFDENIRSGKKMGAALKKMAELIKNDLQNRSQLDIFGKKENITKIEALSRGIEHATATGGHAQGQKTLFGVDSQPSDRSREPDRQRGAAPGDAEGAGAASGRRGEGINEQDYSYQTVLEKATQLTFDWKPRKAAKAAPVHSVRNSPRARMVSTGDIAYSGNVVRDGSDAAALLAHIRKSAQEEAYIVTTDKDGLVLEIHRYSKGTSSSAQIKPLDITGPVLSTPKAKTAYFIHNHPSGAYNAATGSGGGSVASPEDIESAKRIAAILRLKGVDTRSLIIAGTRYVEFQENGAESEPLPIRATVRKMKLPVKERKLLGKRPSSVTPIMNPDAAIRWFAKTYGNRNGVMFLNAKNTDVGFVEWPAGEKTADAAAKIISEAEKSNARGMIINLDRIDENRLAFVKRISRGTAGSIQLFDVVEGGKSLVGSSKMSGTYSESVLDQIGALEDLARDKRPLYSARKSAFTEAGVTLKDIQRAFKGHHVGLNPDGTVWVRFKGGGGIQVKNVNQISADKIAFELAYGRMQEDGEFIAGKYENGTIALQRDIADRFTLSHEAFHHLERSGMLARTDIEALDRAVRLQSKGKIQRPSEEDRAKYVETTLRDRANQPPVFRQVLQKIADFLDSLVNLFHRTARGVVREMESARIYNRPEGGRTKSDAIGAPRFSIKQLSEDSQKFAEGVEPVSRKRFGEKTLSSRMREDFEEAKGVSLKGKKVGSHGDLAFLAQVYRDPRYETFRVVYLKGSEICDHEGFTAKMPSLAPAFKGSAIVAEGAGETVFDYKANREQAISEMKRRMQALGADGYYLLHNHPSGDPKPSKADILVTRHYQEGVPGFRGHIVIDSGTYAAIAPEHLEGDWLPEPADFGPLAVPGLGQTWEDPLFIKTGIKELAGQTVKGPHDIANIARQLKHKTGWATLFYINAKNIINGVQEIPVSSLTDRPIDEMHDFLLEQSRRFGAERGIAHLFADTKKDKVLDTRLTKLIDDGSLLDVICQKEDLAGRWKTESFRGQGAGFFPKKLFGRDLFLSETVAEKIPAYVTQGIEKGGPSQKEMFTDAKGLLAQAKKAHGFGITDRDLGWWNKAFEVPYILAKKFPRSMGRLLKTEIDSAEKRSEILEKDYAEKLGKIQDEFRKDKKAQKELQDLIWKWEGERFPKKDVPTDWFREDEDGSLHINRGHYDEVRGFLKREGVSARVIDGFVAIREKMDEKWIDAFYTMQSEKIDPTFVEEFRGALDKIHNYFPHRRAGNIRISIFDREEKKAVYSRHYFNFTGKAFSRINQAQAGKAARWLEKAVGAGKLPGDLSRYRILQPKKLTRLPQEAFFQINMEGIQQVIGVAGRSLEKSRVAYEAERLFNREGKTMEEARELARQRLGADMEVALSRAVADVFKAQGWGAHAIKREGIPGFIEDDIFGTLFEYLSGYAGFKTKMARARAHSKVLAELDATENPGEYRYAAAYVRDMLENQDLTDRVVDMVRGAFFVKYLGFVVKSGLVNLTQNVVMAAPVLSMHTKGSHLKLARAMTDTRRALTSKAAWTGKGVAFPTLSANEQRALHDLTEKGVTTDQYLRELKGSIPGVGWGRYVKKVINLSGIFMQIAERFNRASTGLAAYRVAVAEKGMRHDKAVEFAKGIVYDSHFLYGKHNLPSFARGSAKAFRAAYTFRSFTHNYLDAMAHMVANQGSPGRKAAARSLVNLITIGGLTSMPFFGVLAGAFMWALGDDDEDPMTKVREMMPTPFTRDLVSHGLIGAAAGADITGSIAIEVPRKWSDIIGVPYSVGEDIYNTASSLKSGQVYRALSETPITPMAIKNAMRGVELFTTGQRSRSGKDINYPGEKGPRKIGGGEAVMKSVLGLQPLSVSKGYEAYQSAGKLKDAISERKRQWADRYVNAVRRGDRREQNLIEKEIREWNQKARAEGRTYRIVDIRKMIRSRMDEDNMKSMPRAMRGRVRDIAAGWQ